MRGESTSRRGMSEQATRQRSSRTRRSVRQSAKSHLRAGLVFSETERKKKALQTNPSLASNSSQCCAPSSPPSSTRARTPPVRESCRSSLPRRTARDATCGAREYVSKVLLAANCSVRDIPKEGGRDAEQFEPESRRLEQRPGGQHRSQDPVRLRKD